MARKGRIEFPRAVYHLLDRGDRREPIVHSDKDRAAFVRTLEQACERAGWRIHAFVLMSNHYHLLIETPTTNLGNGMQLLHGQYARRFNARYKRKGHLFEARYLSPLVDDNKLARTAAYIVANPVAAGLCRDAAGWRWGSHAAIVGPDSAPS